MMLELATQLTDWERDRIRLDFALFVAKRARRYHVDPEQIIDITKSQSAVRSPRSSDGREPSPAGVEGDIDRRHIQIGARHSAEGEVANVAASPAIQPETATGSTAAEKERPQEVGNGAGESLTEPAQAISDPEAGTQAPPVDTTDAPGKSGAEPPSPPAPRTFVPPPNEDHERTAKREEVAALHKAEPWLSPEATAPSFDPRGVTGSDGPSAAPAPEKRRSLRDRVIAMHRMHPTWTARLIANELGAPLSSVSVYLASARRIVAGETASGRAVA